MNDKTMVQLDKCIKKVKRIKRRWMRSTLKNIQSMLELIQDIGVPKNQNEKETLEEYIKFYDNTVAELEKEFLITRYRKLCEEGTKNE